MFSDTQPASLDPLGSGDSFAQFRVDDPFEIRALLKTVLDREVLVNLSGSDGSGYTSTLWAVDAQQGKITFTADKLSPSVQYLVEAEDVAAVCYLDQIKVQFDVHDRVLVHGRQATVLQAAMPREVYRFQRRNAYRVRTIERSSPTATFRHPAMPDMQLKLRVVDVSMGGCALFMPSDMPMLEPGGLINDARMELDADTDFRSGLVVHHVTGLQPESKGVRLGCELRNLSPVATRQLQLYIDQTQKRRRTLSLD
jgi:c-di-GMP-binding flagellar brake protein YcgR